MSEPDNLPTLSAHQVVSTRSLLRLELNLLPERFGIPAFLDVVRDEIAQLRARGRTDSDIAELIHTATGVDVAAEDIGLHAAPSEAPGKPPA